MLSYVHFEIRRLLRTKKVFFAMLLVFMFMAATSLNYYQEAKSEKVYGEVFLQNLNQFLNGQGSAAGNKTTKQIDQVIENWQTTVNEAIQARDEEDWQTYNEKCLETGVYLYRYLENYSGEHMQDYAYLTQRNDDIEAVIEKRGLQDIEVPDISGNTELLSLRLNSDILLSEYHDAVHIVQQFDRLLDADLAPITQHQIDSVSIFFHALQNLVPIFFVVILVIFFDSVANDHEQGMIKNILSQPYARRWYAFAKSLAQSVVGFLIITLPTAIISLFLSLFDHFRNLSYPMLYFKDGLTSLAFSYNKIHAMENMVYYGYADSSSYYMGLVRYSPYGISHTISKYQTNPYAVSYTGVLGTGESFTGATNYGSSPHMDMEYMEMWKFLLLAFVLTLLFLLFIVSLNMLLTSIVKAKVIALGTGFLLCIFAYLHTPVENLDPVFIGNPFSYKNPVEVIGGTSTYPFLAGVLILSGSILLLQLLNMLWMRKQDC